MKKSPKVHAVRRENRNMPPQPITPGLTHEERKARWIERMEWPADYVHAPRSRQTAIGEVARLWS